MNAADVNAKVLVGVVAFCALAFGGVETASAGCGDYLAVGHDETSDAEQGRTPCDGPNCQRSDAPPFAPTPGVQAPPPSLKSAWWSAAALADPLPSVDAIQDSESSFQAGHPSSILRPPRSA